MAVAGREAERPFVFLLGVLERADGGRRRRGLDPEVPAGHN